MKINISNEMAAAVIAALREHIETNGRQDFGPKDEYQVSNEEALEFFEEHLEVENAVMRKLARRREAFLATHMQDNKSQLIK